MVDRGRFGEALDAMLDAHQVFVNLKRSVDERKSLRSGLVKIAAQVAVRPDLAPEVYAQARGAVELALLDEPDRLEMSAVLGAVLYRQGEYALAAERLGVLQETLRRSPEGRLKKKIAPVVHAFRALAHARLGDDAVAREELESLRAALDGGNTGEDERAILREVEAVVAHTPSSTGDG